MTAFDLRGHLTPSGVSFKSATCRKGIKKDGGIRRKKGKMTDEEGKLGVSPNASWEKRVIRTI